MASFNGALLELAHVVSEASAKDRTAYAKYTISLMYNTTLYDALNEASLGTSTKGLVVLIEAYSKSRVIASSNVDAIETPTGWTAGNVYVSDNYREDDEDVTEYLNAALLRYAVYPNVRGYLDAKHEWYEEIPFVLAYGNRFVAKYYEENPGFLGYHSTNPAESLGHYRGIHPASVWNPPLHAVRYEVYPPAIDDVLRTAAISVANALAEVVNSPVEESLFVRFISPTWPGKEFFRILLSIPFESHVDITDTFTSYSPTKDEPTPLATPTSVTIWRFEGHSPGLEAPREVIEWSL